MSLDFAHLVEFDEAARLVRIHRISPDGTHLLYTEAPVPLAAGAGREEQFKRFCQTLGENIILDSPVGRRLIDPG